jgi:hypothetical protein
MFDNTKVELKKWFLAIYIVTSHKKGISSLQLSRDIDVTQKTAWFMLQRIRNCFGIPDNDQSDNEVEIDETFVGGKNKNRHNGKKVKHSQGKSFEDKTPILGIIERKGRCEYYMTLEEISERLGLAITQIRAIEQTALTK